MQPALSAFPIAAIMLFLHPLDRLTIDCAGNPGKVNSLAVMAETVSVKPELIRWAISRSRLALDDLTTAFPKLGQWLGGEQQPTAEQLEAFAHRTMTPLGYLFLDEPPDEKLDIPDFRTVGDTPIDRPSPNLLEMIQVMKRRQAWMRDYLIEEGQEPLDFVASSMQARNVVSLAARIREKLGLNPDWAEVHSTWEEALRTFRSAAERIGVLVATSAVVGLNNHRPLDPQDSGVSCCAMSTRR